MPERYLDTLVFREQEVRSRAGKWYLMRIMPYRTSENLIDGLTVTFVEIVATQQEQLEARDIILYLKSIFDTIHEPTLLMHSDLRVAAANKAFYDTFQVTMEKTEGKLIFEIGNNQWDNKQLRHLLEDIIPEKTVFEDFLVDADIPNRGVRAFLLNARQLERASGLPGLILLSMKATTGTR